MFHKVRYLKMDDIYPFERKLPEIRHELVIHRLILLSRCSRILQSLLVVAHFLVSYCIVYPIVGSEKKPIGFRQSESHRIPSVEIRPDSVVRSDRI
jgi:hypothetical protein